VTAFVLNRVDVDESCVRALVRLAEGAPAKTSARPGLAATVLESLPGVARHRCDCQSARGIASELADTELPHLLEHVALELMCLSGSPRTLGGRTSWEFGVDGPRVYRIRLEYDDDLVAVGALEAGARVIDGLLGVAPMPDIATEVERLRALRDR
jgi:hypothetical protein